MLDDSRSTDTDVVSNVQLGGVQLYVVLIMLCTGRDWDHIEAGVRRRGDFSFRRIHRRATQGWLC